MANVITIKRSAVQGKVPLVGDLALGELAINTYDGKIFLKKNVGGTETIVAIGSTADTLSTARLLWGQSFDGSANVSGSLTSVGNITGSSAVTLAAGGTNQNVTITPSGTGNTILNGNVGIGVSTPTYKLEVAGSFAATTKSFVIKHPSKPNMKLQYGSLESPYHGIRLTGQGEVVDGVCRVDLPDYIHALCHADGVNIQLTNIKHSQTLWVDQVSVEGNHFTVKMKKTAAKTKKYKFFWSFSAVRKDIERLEVEV